MLLVWLLVSVAGTAVAGAAGSPSVSLQGIWSRHFRSESQSFLALTSSGSTDFAQAAHSTHAALRLASRGSWFQVSPTMPAQSGLGLRFGREHNEAQSCDAIITVCGSFLPVDAAHQSSQSGRVHCSQASCAVFPAAHILALAQAPIVSRCSWSVMATILPALSNLQTFLCTRSQTKKGYV